MKFKVSLIYIMSFRKARASQSPKGKTTTKKDKIRFAGHVGIDPNIA